MRHSKMIIGIDEAGRGPLAGPVVMAGVKIATCDKRQETCSKRQATRILKGIRDSKKLSAKKREEWYLRLTAHPDIEWAVAIVSHAVIDRINISRAANRAARRVYSRLSLENSRLSLEKGRIYVVLLDAGLVLPRHIRHKAIIKGDEKISVISAASIIAKVTRDRIMIRMHKKYPQYGFDTHKGYGTKLHRAMLREHGPCPIHRQSFRLL